MNIQGKWNTAFYRAFQEGQGRLIKLWEDDTWQEQDRELSWTNYLPVTNTPYGDFSQLRGRGIPSGTPIRLSDGTDKLVEAISPGDRILTQATSNTSVPVKHRPIHQAGKAQLVGFNGEKPSFPSSQVFRTPTGLRAVDLKAAQSQNPYQQIGILAVGHIIFQIQGGEYAAVEIKSISQTEEVTLDRVWTLTLPREQQTLHLHGYLVDTNNPSQTLRQTIETLRKVPGSQRLGVLSHCQELWPMFQKFEGRSISQRLNWELFGRYDSPDGEIPVKNAGKRSRLSFDDRLNAGKALSMPVGAPVHRLARGFSLTPHHPDRLPTAYELPTLSLIDGYLLVQDEVQLRSRYDPRQRCFRWTRQLQDQRLFEHGAVEIFPEAMAGTGAVYLSAESDAQSLPPRDQVHSFKACARDLEAPSIDVKASTAGFQSISKWNLTLDRSAWPADTERDEPEDPVDGGILEQGFWTSAAGHQTNMVRLPLVEDLRDQINKTHDKRLGDFYKVTSRFPDGELEHTVNFSRAPLVPFVSDAGLDLKNKFAVGFKSDLGIDVTLPALYQQMTFKFDVTYKHLTGYFFEYDPTKRGYKGDRHLVTGTPASSKGVDSCRSKISHFYASVSKPGEILSADEKPQPATVTKGLLTRRAPSVDDLLKFTVYDERELHNASQGLIQKMMLYHMDDDQRDKILREPKPKVPADLPSDLADNLQSDLKTFFKNKYAPAFICRYVGRTQKYSPSFTDQEIKNLWYWWEGNGPNSLSQSKEYNDINRMASRGAMLLRYEDKLAPYLDDDPDKWAESLHNELMDDTTMLLNWVHNPTDGKNNLINKQCNILDALKPSKDWSQQFFDEFMAFALQQGVDIADIEDGDQDQTFQWIQDSMKELIVAILSGDDTMSAEVRQALMDDINKFEEENGLNQQLDAADRAAAICEKSAQFMREMAGWMSAIGKGLAAAFQGSAAFTWFGKAFDQLAEKFTPVLKGVSWLKGLGTISMVVVNLLSAAASIWGLVNNWNSMSDGARATVIIEAMRMVVDAASKAIDAFNSYKSKPSSTAADELNMETLNEKLSETITESNEKLGDIAQEIAGDEDYRTAIGEGLQGDGVPIEGEPKESWNEELSNIAEDVPPGYEEVAKKFNISGNLLRILNAILGIGLVVAMSFSLASDWDSLSDTGKVLGVLNVVVQGLTVLLDIIDLGAEVGLYAVTGAMSAALPILGAVLAIIGVVLMIVQLFINLFVARQPPPDPIQDFIDDVGHALIKTFDKSPEPQLTYTISKTDVSAGSAVTITIEGVNKSSSDVTVSHAKITLYSGNDDVCLFSNASSYIELVTDDDPNHGKTGYTYVTPSSLSGAQLPTPSKLGNTSDYYQYNLNAAGPPRDFSTSLKNLILKQGEKFQSVWTAVVNSKGEDKEKSTSWIELVEVGLKDKCQQQFMLSRV